MRGKRWETVTFWHKGCFRVGLRRADDSNARAALRIMRVKGPMKLEIAIGLAFGGFLVWLLTYGL